jgi:lysophospholipase L1-like esterase
MKRAGLLILGLLFSHLISIAEQADSLTYLALGDSYTVGRNVVTPQTFPYQLVSKLNSKGFRTKGPVVVAQNGWRTDELLKNLADNKVSKRYNFVTLLIGVNNQYQQKNIEDYRTQFRQLLDSAIVYAGGVAKHVIVISIPDWGVTPFANGRNLQKIATEIDAYNQISKEATQTAGATYVNITGLSRDIADDKETLSIDELHPSAKAYGWWVDRIYPAVKSALKK